MTPADRKYTKSHEWVKLDGNKAVMGISDYAQEQLGDITFVELPVVGRDLQQGSECAVIESVKAASDIYAPVSGKVAEVNGELENGPEVINTDPYGAGWICSIEGYDEGDGETLMSAEEYDAYTGDQA